MITITIKPITVVMADDDPDDRLLLEEAWKEDDPVHDLRFVEDGQELLDYLKHNGQYSDGASAPRPELILLDLNMPRKDGREALAEIKTDPALREIPVVILTTSQAETDVKCSYAAGANSVVTKPVTFDALVETVKSIKKYWFQTVELPPGTERD